TGNNQTLYGGQGKNQFYAGVGTSTMNGGAGSNLFVWQAGNGAIIVKGVGSNNTLEAADNQPPTPTPTTHSFTVGDDGSSNHGVQVQFNNSQVIDATHLQQINMDVNGSPDTVTFNSLASTTVQLVAVNVASEGGKQDNLLQTFTLNGATGPKTVNISDAQYTGTVTQPVNGQPKTVNATATLTQVTGLGPTFQIANPEDKLTVKPGDGQTTVTINTKYQGGTLRVDGGNSNDIYNVQAVSAPTTINTSPGNNVFNVGSNAPAGNG